MRRDVTTVQRWEKREGMPVHRHVHDKIGSVYAFKTDLDSWARNRRLLVAESDSLPDGTRAAESASTPGSWRRRWVAMAGAGAFVLAAVAIWYYRAPGGSTPADPLADARFSPLTDFDGIEQAAAISRDGRFVAFLSDRDGRMDVWVTQVGVGQFYNLTRGSVPGLVNPSVRSLAFSPDGNFVTFWVRPPDGASTKEKEIGVWAVPVLGGQPQLYLEGVEFDWASDGTLVYHTATDGDPTFVRSPSQSPSARQIFAAPKDLHAHFQLWSPDREFIYFVQGVPRDHGDVWDIWRIRPNGGTPERITHHESRVSHPVFLNSRTLLYLAGDPDGSGPWIHSIDVEERTPRRLTTGLDRYTSLAGSADGRRLVATLANPKGSLWQVPIGAQGADMSAARRIALNTGKGSSPRLGGDVLFYVSSTGNGDTLWRLNGERAAELWSAPEARVIGAPAVTLDGRRVAFAVRQKGQRLLYVANADGTEARVLAHSLELQGSPAWAPDGRVVTIAATVNGTPQLFNVPLDGSAPMPLVREYSLDPVWAPDGTFVAYSGRDIGTTFTVKAVKPDGSPHEFPPLTLTRGARHLAMMPGRKLLVLKGDVQHKNLWLVDLQTGAERQLTDLPSDFVVRDFDVTPGGDGVVLERVQEHSDIVLLELPQRRE